MRLRFRETPLAGAFEIEIEPHRDLRGYFARLWCRHEFAEQGLAAEFVQASLSENTRRGTVRGMHLQLAPSREGKLVRCVRGRIHDVVVDLRPDSPTYLQHFAVELDAQLHNALYIPPQLLHGFQTLVDDCTVLYEMTDFHAPELGFGARWNDPAFGIRWPIATDVTILPRDASYPDFDPRAYVRQYRQQSAAAQRASRSGRSP
jgi:dTDP-4-dehydrorhamnose 3,5-epimerase